jgi:hypothetical protein
MVELSTCLHAGFLLGLIFDIKEGEICSFETSIEFNELHGGVSLKKEPVKQSEIQIIAFFPAAAIQLSLLACLQT